MLCFFLPYFLRPIFAFPCSLFIRLSIGTVASGRPAIVFEIIMVVNVPFSVAVTKTGSKYCDVSGVHETTNSHFSVFQKLAFSRIVAGFKSRPIFSFALASI